LFYPMAPTESASDQLRTRSSRCAARG
jgi:hypothetical protein